MLALLVAGSLSFGTPTIRIDFQPILNGTTARFQAIATNISKGTIYVVPQGDGMHSGRRSPLVQIQVMDTKGQWKVPVVLGCGNTNPLTKESFAPLAPGATVDLLAGMAWSHGEVASGLSVPGTYKVRFVYDTTRPILEWLGGPLGFESAENLARELRPFFEKVPKLRFVSEPITLTIKN